MEQIESLTLIGTGIGIITAIATGLKAFGKIVSRGISQLVTQMAQDNVNIIKPIIEEVKGLETVNKKVAFLEETQNDLKLQIEELYQCMRSVNERTDQIYTLLLNRSEQAKK